MGRLIDGRWSTEDLGTDDKGRFVRRATRYQRRISPEPDAPFPAAAGRYHLYLSHACGWSHRTLLWHRLKGLEDIVSVSFAEPHMGDEGWTFGPQGDPVLGRARLYEVYLAADSNYTGRASVPVLWDRETGTIVANESLFIVRSFDRSFDALPGAEGLTFFPADREADIEAMIAANYEPVNNGVYKCGFAGSQLAYDEAATALFARLDALEVLLATQRYLVGDTLTAADLYLFPTLYRFDAIYAVHFKCTLRRLVDYPNLWAWTRDLYQHPGIAGTCDMASTKTHYYTSHESIHPRRIIPLGPELDFDAPHGRGSVGG